MQEIIGTWVTEAGPVGARLDFGGEADGEFKLPSWASGALSGAATGAMTGAAAGPYGALIGAAAGAAIGGVTAAATPSPPPAPPPKAAPAPQKAAAPTQSAPAAQPKAAPTAQPKPVPAGGSGQNAAIAQALQQFAAIVPALIQLAATGGSRAEGSDVSSDGEAAWTGESFAGLESVDAVEWAASATGTWTVS
jgi:hypothetical protein